MEIRRRGDAAELRETGDRRRKIGVRELGNWGVGEWEKGRMGDLFRAQFDRVKTLIFRI